MIVKALLEESLLFEKRRLRDRKFDFVLLPFLSLHVLKFLK